MTQRRSAYPLIASVLLGLFFFTGTHAQEPTADARGRDRILIDDVVEISAPVSGDLFALGRAVLLRGDVAGDILAVGRSVVITGNVTGDVRVAGETVTIDGTVAGSVTMIGRTLVVPASGTIGGNTIFFGERADIGGSLAGTVYGRARAVDLRGSVGGEVTLPSLENVVLHPSAVLNDGLTITAASPLVRHEGAIVHGTITENEPPRVDTKKQATFFVFGRIVSFFSILLLGLVAVHLFQKPSLAIVSAMINAPRRALWKGALLVVLPPIVALLLFFTFIGIPLGLLLLALWMALLYSARVFAGLALGLSLLWHVDRKRRARSVLWPLILGLLLLVLLESIPVVRFSVLFFATLWGVGGIVIVVESIRTTVKKV